MGKEQIQIRTNRRTETKADVERHEVQHATYISICPCVKENFYDTLCSGFQVAFALRNHLSLACCVPNHKMSFASVVTNSKVLVETQHTHTRKHKHTYTRYKKKRRKGKITTDEKVAVKPRNSYI